MAGPWKRVSLGITLCGLLLYLLLTYAFHVSHLVRSVPLWVSIVVGGAPFLIEIARKMLHANFGADILAAISVVTAVLMDQLLVAAIIVLMLSGGEVLEETASRRASSVLSALAKRSPGVAHRTREGGMEDILAADIQIGDTLVLFPHEICPVDGTVVAGESSMDESFLTGEPFLVRKTSGSSVISGALNGDAAIHITASKLPRDSRYARIVGVIEDAERTPPPIRRLGDQLGALYTPLALVLAGGAWLFSGNPTRFLAVIVIATPCPLLLAIPTAIIGSISLAAKRGIIIKKPALLEQVSRVRTMLFDKTGTLTYGQPELTSIIPLADLSANDALRFAASLEQYSKHPLSSAVLQLARQEKIVLFTAETIQEKPGQGLAGIVDGHSVTLTGRKSTTAPSPAKLPEMHSGMQSILSVDGVESAVLQFHDKPRREGPSFMAHLGPKHQVTRLLILSGDRTGEVQHLAETIGIKEVYAGLSPEEKLQIVVDQTKRAPTLFLGDGINDAPAMLAATVGVAFGAASDITSEAAGAVILEPSLERVDELLHIGRRMRRIALQSAVGGIALSVVGMMAAAYGVLPPLWGALGQELLDLLAVLNALRASLPQAISQDFP